MNWYKLAAHPEVQVGSFRSYDTDDINTELEVFVNGAKRTYYGMSSEDAEIIRWMANTKRLPGGVVLKKLRPFSNPKRHEELNPTIPEYTKEEEQETMQELKDRGFII